MEEYIKVFDDKETGAKHIVTYPSIYCDIHEARYEIYEGKSKLAFCTDFVKAKKRIENLEKE